ncbi:sulfotransferase [Rhodobacteraceae bacterium]|nr:sulfotransferase [Paracoccaceae bacterium]
MPTVSTSAEAAQSARYSAGLKLFSDRKFRDAMAEFKAVVAEDRSNAKAHFHIGRIFLETYWAMDALSWFKRAVEIDPKFVHAWLGWAEAVALSCDKTSRTDFLAALKTAPIPRQQAVQLQDRFGALRKGSRPKTGGVPTKDITRLISLMAKGSVEQVEVEATKLLKRAPKCAAAANILAEVQIRQGKTKAALANLKMAIKLDVLYAEAYVAIGQLLFEEGRVIDAASAMRPAVILAPDMVPALAGLGVALAQIGHSNAGSLLLKRAAELEPKNPILLSKLGDVQSKGDSLAAIRTFKAAMGLYRDQIPNGLRIALSEAYRKADQNDLAMGELDLTLDDEPDHVTALISKGSLLQSQGDFSEAEGYFRKAIVNQPTNGDAYRRLLVSHKAVKDDPIIADMVAVFERDDLEDTDRMHLGYGLSKALEDAGEYDRVFEYLNAANQISAGLSHPSKVARFADIRDCRETYGKFDFNAAPDAPRGAVAPIFVTGMPRSGTTLVEQIIAAHSKVDSGGELGYASVYSKEILADGPNATGSTLDPDLIAQIGQKYTDAMQERFPGIAKITDKSIYTFQHIGPLKRAIPDAKFIVVRRDPRDNLLSMYKNRFNDGVHGYANELDELAKFYDEFDRTIAFWRARVPDWFYEVSYDALVSNPEVEARKLIAAAGLEWEDGCLNFHNSGGNVKTLSVYQVRQPITKASVRGWKRFEKDLEPMLARLRSDGHITD